MPSKYVTLATDLATGDILLRPGNGGLQLVRAGDKIIQNIKERLKVFLGEWFLNLNDGVSYYRDFLIKGASKSVMRSVIRNRIASTPGVVEVVSVELSLDRPKRILTIKWKARIEEPTSIGSTVSGSTTYLTDAFGNILTSGGDSLTL